MMRALIVVLLVAVATALPASDRNPMINEGFFEGDIAGIDPDRDRNAVPLDSQRWPNGVVPYVIEPAVSHFREVILRSMQYIEQNSCIRFKERTYEHNYLSIFYGDGCWSFWGLLNKGAQQLSLGHGCDNLSIIVHELLHAIGFSHEQNRSDRDDFLDIHWENIDPKSIGAFRKFFPHENRLLTSFDYDSIMLYREDAYAKAPGLKTMTAKDGRFLGGAYNKPSPMSAIDIQRLNILYQC